MKQLYHLSVLALLAMLSPTATQAQESTLFGECGTQTDGLYLQNTAASAVGEAVYMDSGNKYDTQASLSTTGLPFTLYKSDNTTANLYFVMNAKHLGKDAYVDQNTQNFVFTAVNTPDDGTYTLSYVSNGTTYYLAWDGAGTTSCSMSTTRSENAYWRLVSRQSRLQYMKANGVGSQTAAATFLISNTSFNRNLKTDSWICSPAGDVTMTATSYNDKNTASYNYAKVVAAEGKAFTVTQTIPSTAATSYSTGLSLPAGTYTMSLQGFYQYAGTGTPAPVISIGNGQDTKTVSLKHNNSAAIDANTFRQLGAEYTYTLDGLQLSEGETLTISLQLPEATDDGGQLVIYFDNVQLTYTGGSIANALPTYKSLADEALGMGGKYQITTTIDGTTYYLTSGGRLADSETQAETFNIVKFIATGTGVVANEAYHIFGSNGQYFTNVGSSNTYLYTSGKNKRRDWEAQVLYKRGDRYAVLGTNVNNPNVGYSHDYYWSARAVEGGAQAYYAEPSTLENDFVWSLKRVGEYNFFDSNKLYTIASVNTNTSGNHRYWYGDGTTFALSPNEDADATTTHHGRYALLPAEGSSTYFIYDVDNHRFMDPATWTYQTNPAPVYIAQVDENSFFVLGSSFSASTSDKCYANISGGIDKDALTSYYFTNKNSRWNITTTEGEAVYDISQMTEHVRLLANSAALQKATLQYTGSVNQYGTLVLPFATALPAGIQAYMLTSNVDADIYGEEVTAIDAHTPVLLKGTATAMMLSGPAQRIDTDEPMANGLLQGVYAGYTTTTGDYVLQNHADEGFAFYRVDTGVATPAVTPFHAYLRNTSGAAKKMSLALQGQVTAVEQAETHTEQGQQIETIYSADGMKRKQLSKGLNIVRNKNGKIYKVFVR